MPDVVTIVKPDHSKILPLVFDSPHSGNHYPEDFKYGCDLTLLKQTEDRFVDDLFACSPRYGATLIKAEFSRSYIDVNRAVDDIDPAVLSEEWPADDPGYGEIKPTARSAAGIGLIRRLIRPGEPVYNRDLTPAEIKQRIEKYYTPYHDVLAETLNETHYNYGQVWHINCHSMPSSSARPKRPIGFIASEPKQTDFCLGNLDGRTCSLDFTHSIRNFLRDLGYTVTINDPFKGVTLIGSYSAPSIGRHGLQLEINRSLYMDEETCEKSKNYDAFKEGIEKFVAFCAGYASSQLTTLAAD